VVCINDEECGCICWFMCVHCLQVNGIEEEEKNDAEKMMSLTGVVVDD